MRSELQRSGSRWKKRVLIGVLVIEIVFCSAEVGAWAIPQRF